MKLQFLTKVALLLGIYSLISISDATISHLERPKTVILHAAADGRNSNPRSQLLPFKNRNWQPTSRVPRFCRAGLTEDLELFTLCSLALSGVLVNTSTEIVHIGNLTGTVNATLNASVSGVLDVVKDILNATLELHLSIRFSLICNGSCLAFRRHLRGKLVFRGLEKKLRTAENRTIPPLGDHKFVTHLTVPWFGILRSDGNASINFTQNYFVNSSLQEPGISAYLPPPNVTSIAADTGTKFHAIFRVFPATRIKFTRTNVFVRNNIAFMSGFKLRSSGIGPFPAMKQSKLITEDCLGPHSWRGQLTPLLKNISATYDSTPNLGWEPRKEHVSNAGNGRPLRLCANPRT